MSTKILLTADLHIGLTSSRVRSSNSNRTFGTAEAWLRIVDLANAEAVRAVLMAGDVIDQNNKFFEAIGPLQRGIEQLAEDGIVTIAVSGNHDHDVLRRLASELPPDVFRLLGADGDWERSTIGEGDNPLLNVDGISFPTTVVQTSPLKAYDLPRELGTPTIGIIHGDIYDQSSRYRPLELGRLQRLPVDGWLLGHIHAQELIEESGSPWVLYPGSPQALDPGEEGLHGPWIAELEGSTLHPPVQRPLSSALYATVDIDLSNVQDRDSLEGSITSQIRDQAAEILAKGEPALRVAALRCHIHGTTPFADDVRHVAQQLKAELELEIGNVATVVDSCTTDVIPPIEIEQYARSKSAPGEIARLLLGLDAPDPSDEIRRLIDDVVENLKRVDNQSYFADLDDPGITEQTARDYILRQAQAVLAELVKDEL